jgi:hypothetical protein
MKSLNKAIPAMTSRKIRCKKYVILNVLGNGKVKVNFSLEQSGLGSLVVSMLASGTQVIGFKPGRSRRIFRRGSKAVVPMSQLCGS